MKDKNLPDDIKAKSLDELREILNSCLLYTSDAADE